MSQNRTFSASRLRTPLIALGAFTLAVHVGCSDDPQPNTPMFPQTSAGSGGSSAGSGNSTAGSFTSMGGTTAGTFGTGGSAGSTAGTGGTTGGGGAGTAGSASGNGGSGGTGVVVPKLDCSKETGKALPVALTSAWGFPDSDQDSYTESTVSGMCAEDAPEGAPGCWTLAWTPATRSYVAWIWHNTMQNWSGPGVCVAAGAKAVTFKAKADAAVTAEFGAAGASVMANLTTEWQDFSIDISAINYNNVHTGGGVNTGISVAMGRMAGDTTARTIYFYDVQWVAEAGGGGEGGAGNGGGGEGGGG